MTHVAICQGQLRNYNTSTTREGLVHALQYPSPLYILQEYVLTMATQSHGKCHDGKCISCTLCQKSNPKYTHPVQIKLSSPNVYEWIKDKHPFLADHQCICLPCIKHIKRNYLNPGTSLAGCPKYTNLLRNAALRGVNSLSIAVLTWYQLKIFSIFCMKGLLH